MAPPHAVGQHSWVALQSTVGPQSASHTSTESVGGHDPVSHLDSAIPEAENVIKIFSHA